MRPLHKTIPLAVGTICMLVAIGAEIASPLLLVTKLAVISASVSFTAMVWMTVRPSR